MPFNLMLLHYAAGWLVSILVNFWHIFWLVSILVNFLAQIIALHEGQCCIQTGEGGGILPQSLRFHPKICILMWNAMTVSDHCSPQKKTHAAIILPIAEESMQCCWRQYLNSLRKITSIRNLSYRREEKNLLTKSQI